MLGPEYTLRCMHARTLLCERAIFVKVEGAYCEEVRGCARLCKGVQGCARVCKAVQGCARVCEDVQGCAKGVRRCARMREDVRGCAHWARFCVCVRRSTCFSACSHACMLALVATVCNTSVSRCARSESCGRVMLWLWPDQ